tara:strand:- start:1817 stop:2803 length:987 start_codon:yes stop_codon:yes gene_type:complete
MDIKKLKFLNNYRNLDQRLLAKTVFDNVKKRGIKLTNELGPLDNHKYYRSLNKCLHEGRAYETGGKTYEFWKFWLDKNLITFEELKSAETQETQPRIKDYSKSFDELWDDIGDTSDGTDAQAEAANDLKDLIIENCPEIEDFIKDPKGEPFLEFYNNPVQRKFFTDYSTEEISEAEDVKLMTELSEIFDKLMNLQVNNNGKIIINDFLGSPDRLKSKLRGYEIFEKLKKKKIFISLAKSVENAVFQSKTEIVNNVLILKTTVGIATTMSLVFGSKKNYKPKGMRPYDEVVSDHAHKAANLLKSHLIIGKQPVNESLVNFPTSKNKLNK